MTRKISAVILLLLLQIVIIACGTGLNRFVFHCTNRAISFNAIMACGALVTVLCYFGVIRPRLLLVPTPFPSRRVLLWATVVTVLVMTSLGAIFIGVEASARLAWWRLTPQLLFLTVSGVLYIPLLEEILFRDMLLRWSLPYMHWSLAVILQGMLFSAAHFYEYVFYWNTAISLGLSGMVLAMAWLYTRNLYFPIMLHASLNFFLHIFNGFDSQLGWHPGIITGERSMWQFYLLNGYKVLACLVLGAYLHKHHKITAAIPPT